ncbi:hypothetical protein [Streptomyces sp. NPDC006638]|uniref:hypothetical protein n=1 Tax=Streptomyces sp. NPDC006638 TaxID=3157183 RepID=UPI0033A2BE7F
MALRHRLPPSGVVEVAPGFGEAGLPAQQLAEFDAGGDLDVAVAGLLGEPVGTGEVRLRFGVLEVRQRLSAGEQGVRLVDGRTGPPCREQARAGGVDGRARELPGRRRPVVLARFQSSAVPRQRPNASRITPTACPSLPSAAWRRLPATPEANRSEPRSRSPIRIR